MTPQSFRPTPQFKIDVGTTTYTNDASMRFEVTRPENNISSLVMTLDDYKSKNYIGIFDAFTQVTVSLRYGTDAWTTVFKGRVYDLKPSISALGELLTISCWGLEYGLVITYCDTTWGTESQNHPAHDTPFEIIEHLIAAYVDKAYGFPLQNTRWNIATNKTMDVHNDLSVHFLSCNYMDNFSAINRLCDIISAHALAEAEVGAHWFVDVTPEFYMKKIDENHTDGTWDHYWNGTGANYADPGTQASSTITVTQDMILYDFRKHIEDYANDIIISSAFRMPPEDRWTENGSALWGTTNTDLHDSLLATPDATDPSPVVGGYDLKAHPNLDAIWSFRYPIGNAAWDLEKITSPKTPSYLSFYARRNDHFRGLGALCMIKLCTDANNYFYPYTGMNTHLGDAADFDDKWVYLQYPIGPYHELWLSSYTLRWFKGGAGANPDWGNINWIEFNFPANPGLDAEFFLDDIHFSGTVVRRAYDSDAWPTYYGHQKVLRNDTAVSDSLIADETEARITGNSAGTIAMLAYAELKRRMQAPIVGAIQIPLAPSILPGQTVHIHAAQTSAATPTYRIDKDMRIKELRHRFTMPYPTTVLSLTDDVSNSNSITVPSIVSILQEHVGALMHMEAKDLKGGGLDNLIPRLEKDY